MCFRDKQHKTHEHSFRQKWLLMDMVWAVGAGYGHGGRVWGVCGTRSSTPKYLLWKSRSCQCAAFLLCGQYVTACSSQKIVSSREPDTKYFHLEVKNRPSPSFFFFFKLLFLREEGDYKGQQQGGLSCLSQVSSWIILSLAQFRRFKFNPILFFLLPAPRFYWS